MRLPFDKTNAEGDKIRNEPTDSGIKEVNMSAMFERPGRRVTTNIDILVYEGLADRDDVKNVAVPGHVEAARQARTRIERARERGLSPAEALGAFDDDTSDQTRQSFRDGLDARTTDPMTDAIHEQRTEAVGGTDDQPDENQDGAEDDEGSWTAADALGGGA